MLVNIRKLKPYQFIASKMKNYKIQISIYWEEPQITNQPWRGVQKDTNMNEDEDDKAMPQ
jgi:hypothetical protein